MLSISTVFAQSTYIITGSGTQFTATKDGAPVSNNQPIQTVIDAIKVDASGTDCTIRFEAGTSTLNIGAAGIIFDGGTTGEAWGLITLIGKLTSTYADGVIYLTNGVSINSQADITSTASSNFSVTLYNDSTGQVHISSGVVEAKGANTVAVATTSKGKITVSDNAVITSCNINKTVPGTILIVESDGTSGTCLEITDGTVENTAPLGMTICNKSPGAINISGGTVSATTGIAINSTSTGKVTISGTALVTSSCAENIYQGTIYFRNEDTTTAVCLEITGGTVENTADEGGIAISNNSLFAINISGGTVSATGYASMAIANSNMGSINISGGTVSSVIEDYFGTAIYNFNEYGIINISGGTVSATGDYNAAILNDGTVNISGGTVSGCYAIGNSASGTINISGGTVSATGDLCITIGNADIMSAPAVIGNTVATSGGVVNISGGTVSATAGGEGAAILNGSMGTVTITGGTVSANGDECFAIYNGYMGAVTISGGTVSATVGWAVYNEDGTTDITGGICFAYGTIDEDVIFGNYTQNGDAVIVAWNEAAGITTYEFNTDDDIYKFPATATAVWAKQGDDSGIAVDNEENIGFIALPVTITGVNIVETRLIASVQVYPNPTKGEFWVSGFEVSSYELQVTGIEIFDVMGKKLLTSPLSLTPPEGGSLPSFGGVGGGNISHLPSVIYFIKITTENGIITKKIIKN